MPRGREGLGASTRRRLEHLFQASPGVTTPRDPRGIYEHHHGSGLRVLIRWCPTLALGAVRRQRVEECSRWHVGQLVNVHRQAVHGLTAAVVDAHPAVPPEWLTVLDVRLTHRPAR